MKDSPESELFTTRRVAVVEGDREAAEMLHTFLLVMELEASLVDPGSQAVPTLRRLAPDVLLLDLDLPDLRALEIARESAIRAVVFMTDHPPNPTLGAPVVKKPHGRFEDFLMLFEAMLDVE